MEITVCSKGSETQSLMYYIKMPLIKYTSCSLMLHCNWESGWELWAQGLLQKVKSLQKCKKKLQTDKQSGIVSGTFSD